MHQLMCQPLHIVRTSPWVNDSSYIRFFLQVKLRIARNARGEISRQRQRFIQRVGVQRLGMPESRGQRFDAGAHHIVVRILRREAPAGSLAMRPQDQGLRILWVKGFD